MNIFSYLRFSSLVLFSFVFTASQAQKEEDYFITVWDLSLNWSGRESISFYSLTQGEVDYIWETVPAGKTGIGKFNANNTLITIDNLPSKATIKLKLAGVNLKRFYLDNLYAEPPHADALTDVKQWGIARWLSMERAFARAENLTITATDVPNLMAVTSLRGMFYKCYKLNGPANINQWNTQNVSNMGGIFSYARSFNQPIGNWNTQNVVVMDSLFVGATAFNQNISNWNTDNVIHMDRTFSNATSFNQPLENWNTAKVEEMFRMFSNTNSFNQPIGKWNTLNVKRMEGMFNNAISFNQRLDSLELNTVKDLNYMLNNCGMDCKNYSYTLIGWANNPKTPINKSFGAAGLKYSTLAKVARDILTKPVAQGGKGWTIEGDILSTDDCGIILGQENAVSQAVISLYPNPAQDKLFLKNATAASAYKIIDNLGRTITSGICQNEEISIAALPSGLYKLVCEHKHFTFVKE